MAVFLKRLGWAALALLVLAVAAAAGGYLWLRGSLPEMDGERAVSGLAAPVEVVRDRHGVPHVLARNEEDALFALGYVHAEDRLWQMEMNRRIGAGRLAEVLGTPALATDRLLRVLGLHHRAKATLAHLSPGARRRIDAYVNGVNAWMEGRTGPLPPEFLILGFEPEPWTAADTVVWTKGDGARPRERVDARPHAASDVGLPRPGPDPRLLYALPRGPAPRRPASRAIVRRSGERRALHAGYGLRAALGHGSRGASLGDRNAACQRPGRPRNPGPPRAADPRSGARAAYPRPPRQGILPPGGRDRLTFAAEPPRRASSTLAPAGFPLRPASGHPGSNSWAVSGARSVTGKPFLANDPHLRPHRAFGLVLSPTSPGRDATSSGRPSPGMPVVVLGHNGRAAWGFTNTGADTQDLFLEKLDPEDPARYLTPGGYRRFDVRREVIEVKDGDDVVVHVRESRHGPVLDDGSAAAARASPPGHVLALGWAALRDDDLTLEAGLGLPEARDWASFVENLRNFHSPPQNISYADVDATSGSSSPAGSRCAPPAAPRAAPAARSAPERCHGPAGRKP